MKNLDFKMRQRFNQKEYFGVTRLDKKEMKEIQRNKRQMQQLTNTKKIIGEYIHSSDAPTIQGAMVYECESCRKSFAVGLEIGVEDFGKNGRPHQPCPFCIRCDCGGIARDVTGYMPFPYQVKVKKGMKYFAYDNSGVENACGKLTIY